MNELDDKYVNHETRGNQLTIVEHPCYEIMKNYENPWKSMQTMEYDESPQRTRRQPGIERSRSYLTVMQDFQISKPEIHEKKINL